MTNEETKAFLKQNTFKKSQLPHLSDGDLENVHRALEMGRAINRKATGNSWGIFSLVSLGEIVLPIPPLIKEALFGIVALPLVGIINTLEIKSYIFERRLKATEKEIFRRNTGVSVPADISLGFDAMARRNLFVDYRQELGKKVLSPTRRRDIQQNHIGKMLEAERAQLHF